MSIKCRIPYKKLMRNLSRDWEQVKTWFCNNPHFNGQGRYYPLDLKQMRKSFDQLLAEEGYYAKVAAQAEAEYYAKVAAQAATAQAPPPPPQPGPIAEAVVYPNADLM